MPRKAVKKKPTGRRKAVTIPANNRTRAGNGVSLFVDGSLDERSIPARRYKELVHSFSSDLGGFSNLSEFEKQLTRRSAALAVMCELDECKLAKGEEIDPQRFNGNVNTLRRLGETLGVKRVVLDLQPSLSELMAQKVAEREQKDQDDNERGDGDDA